MKTKKLKIIKSIISIIAILVLSQTITYAHSGRTDANGGHKDNKNASGLGSYHYHCGGNPPHLHSNGVCPYSSSSASSSSSSKSTSNKKSSSSKTTSSQSSASTEKSSASTAPKTIAVTSVQIQDKSKTELTTGESYKLTATIEPTNATNNQITWSSNDTSIATVNSNGEVTALKEGTVKITSKSSNGKEDSIELNIKNPDIKVSKIILDEESTSINVGNTKHILVTVEPDNATNKTITWTSSNKNIAKVENGKITAIAEGTVDIIATSENGISSTCKVTVIDPNKSTTKINSNNSQTNDTSSQAFAVGSLAAVGGGAGIALAVNKKRKNKNY